MTHDARPTLSTWAEDAEALLTATDRDVVRLSGFGQSTPFGTKPALLVIDVTEAFCGDKSEPILTSVERYRNSCGEVAWEAIPVIADLISVARETETPVIYTRGMPQSSGVGPGKWAAKNKRATEDRGEQHNIVVNLAPESGDLVLDKAKPSAFFGTPLLSLLIERGIDSLIVVGCTTSGCVRASVVDAFSNNIPVTVVAEGCFDRVAVSHTASLFDMNLKYADVMHADQVTELLRLN